MVMNRTDMVELKDLIKWLDNRDIIELYEWMTNLIDVNDLYEVVEDGD